MLPLPAGRQSKRRLEKITAIVSIIGIIVAGFAIFFAYQSNIINQQYYQESLNNENILSNYEPQLIPYSGSATFGDVYQSDAENLTGSNYLLAFGRIDISLVAITPHACIINFTDSFKIEYPDTFEVMDSASTYLSYANIVPNMNTGHSLLRLVV